MRQRVFGARDIQTGPFAFLWSTIALKSFQLFNFHTRRPIVITPDAEVQYWNSSWVWVICGYSKMTFQLKRWFAARIAVGGVQIHGPVALFKILILRSNWPPSLIYKSIFQRFSQIEGIYHWRYTFLIFIGGWDDHGHTPMLHDHVL